MGEREVEIVNGAESDPLVDNPRFTAQGLQHYLGDDFLRECFGPQYALYMQNRGIVSYLGLLLIDAGRKEMATSRDAIQADVFETRKEEIMAWMLKQRRTHLSNPGDLPAVAA